MDEPIRLLKLTESSSGAQLTISGREEPLAVSLETVYRHRLVEGIVLTEAQVAMLCDEAALFQCGRRAARLLAMRDHSVGELRAKLRRRRFPKKAIEAVVKQHRESGTLDDERYAAAVAGSLLARRPCGLKYLSAYLQRRKIDRELADRTAEMLLADQDDTTLATSALEQRWSRFGQFELETARTKSYNYLARRGFGYRSAKAAFDRLWQQTKEGTDD